MNVQAMTAAERLGEVINRSDLGPDAKALKDSLVSPANLAIMAATLALWAGSHLVGVGEIVDVLLLVVGAFTIGWSIGDVAKDVYTVADKVVNARTEADLDAGAKAFSHAVVLAGFTVIMALLLRRSVKQISAARGPNVSQAMKPKSPGLPKVSADPEAGKLWSNPKIETDPSLAAGRGSTSPFGRVRLSPHGTTTEQALVRAHELVHRFLSPRFGILRTFRARVSLAGYKRSALLLYLEEALAETIAQLRTNGFSGLIEGIRFPIDNGYLNITQLMSEGAEIGTIIIGTQHFSVQFIEGAPDPQHTPNACYATCQ